MKRKFYYFNYKRTEKKYYCLALYQRVAERIRRGIIDGGRIPHENTSHSIFIDYDLNRVRIFVMFV